MNSVTRLLVAAGLILLIAPATTTQAQQRARITGTVTDASDGGGLPANVTIVGTLTGTQADPVSGQYEVSGLDPGSYSVQFGLLGYVPVTESVTLAAGQTVTLNVQLTETVIDVGGEVTVVGNKVVKREDFPMPMETISAAEILNDVSTSSEGILRKKTGVDMQCTGVDRCETVLRGFNNAFSGSAYVLTDYRQAAVPSLGVNINSITPALTLDVDRVEVVRGPASALYGAGVDAGVIHFFSKDPFTKPGTSISVSGGERSFILFEGRHALRVSDKFAYKITGMYGQADDWELDIEDRADSIFARQDCAPADDPEACFAAGGARNTDYNKYNVNGSLHFKLGDRTEFIASGGQSGLDATVLSGIGTLQADGYAYTYGQVRFQTRNDREGFFGQAYVNRNDAGDSFVYGSELFVVDTSVLYNVQLQYDRTFGRHSVVGGVDLQFTRPDTDGKINGRNEERDNTDEYGAYAQGQVELSRRLSLTGAVRGDYDSVTEDFQISPRAAATLHIGPRNREKVHTVRGSFNIAFSSPGTNSNFLDIVAGSIPGTSINVIGSGSAFGHEWRRDPQYGSFAPTDLVATSLLPTSLGSETPQGVFLQEIHGLVHAGVDAVPDEVLAAQINAALMLPPNTITPQTAALLVNQLSPANTTVTGFTPGLLGVLNTTTGELDFVSDLTDIEPLKKTTTTTVELGYTGVFESVGKGLVINVDAYYSNKKDFVGPLLMETPFVVVPNLESSYQSALAVGIGNNPVLAGILGQLGVSPEAAAGLVVGFVSDQLPSAVAIVEAADNVASPGQTPELMLSYRNFGKIDFTGVDASFELQASNALSFFGNVSYVSDDFFDNEELEEENVDLRVALNAPKFKGRLGGQYTAPGGFYFNVAGRYTDSFPIQSGPYVGINCRLDLPGATDDCLESYFLLDVGAGYVFRNQLDGLRFDVTVNNVLDDSHREFIGAPKVGRMAIARLTYTIN